MHGDKSHVLAEHCREIVRRQYGLWLAFGSHVPIQQNDVRGMVRNGRKVVTDHELGKIMFRAQAIKDLAEEILAAESTPAAGSSSTSRSGSCCKARARSARCISPPESVPTGRFSRASAPTSASQFPRPLQMIAPQSRP